MYIAMLTPECAPVAHAGGLGDVVFGLTRELEARGHSVDIILPRYRSLRMEHVSGWHRAWADLRVPWYEGAVRCSVWSGDVHGRRCFFIEPHSDDHFFQRSGFYGYEDDPLRFGFFSRAALEFLLQSGKRPDVMHCHDWPTGLVPVLLCDHYADRGLQHARVCFTIHNFKHQGIAGEGVLRALGLGRRELYLQYDRLRDDFDPAAINFAKSGIVSSHFVTTVSRRHAWEAAHTDQGCGLGHALHLHRHKFGGVLNGVDYEIWNPERDGLIPQRYGVDTLEGKYRNKEALRERLGLRKGFTPLIAYVGRLDPQKGIPLIRHALRYSLAHGAQFVLLGPPWDPGAADEFWRLKRELNDDRDCHLELRFDADLAHLVYAGADMLVVPSDFEPCGLVQMIALKYGTVPIVRDVGGLGETIRDRDFASEPPEQRNGYVFQHPDESGIESALRRAIGLWYDHPQEFRQLIGNGMRIDHSWHRPGQDYVNIYEHIRRQ